MSSSVSFAPGAASGSGEHTPTSPKLAAFIEPVRRSLDGVRTALSHIHLPHLPRKSSEVGRKSQGAEKEGEETDPELDALRGFLGTWVLDRKESDSDDGLLKMQGVSMYVFLAVFLRNSGREGPGRWIWRCRVLPGCHAVATTSNWLSLLICRRIYGPCAVASSCRTLEEISRNYDGYPCWPLAPGNGYNGTSLSFMDSFVL